MDNLKLYFDETTNKAKKVLENKYVYSTIMLFLVMYGSLAAPKLPDFISSWFENPIIRLVLLFLIAFISSKDYSVALIVALGVSVTLQTQVVHKLNKALWNLLNLNESRLLKQPMKQSMGEQSMEQPMEQPIEESMGEQPMEQLMEQPMEQDVNKEHMKNPMPNNSNVNKLSTAVGDTMGLNNDRDDMDYLTNYGYSAKCPGKFDPDIINPNNQYLYESVYSGNTV